MCALVPVPDATPSALRSASARILAARRCGSAD